MSSVEDINVDDSPESPVDSKDNALFEPKAQPKIIRVLTVLAYILSVSMAAILLSIYYIFMWNEHKTYALHNEFVPPGAASSLMEEANFTTPTFNTDQLPQIDTNSDSDKRLHSDKNLKYQLVVGTFVVLRKKYEYFDKINAIIFEKRKWQLFGL
nr:PREDICTED: uncharacterized protein LOC103313833 isoform X3 [Tribolium castaneum]|eukprot:XP_015837208.1 PREDICTED: uncharacterized protein LOC103313833 isoform X3 [Tribolium castaneum]